MTTLDLLSWSPPAEQPPGPDRKRDRKGDIVRQKARADANRAAGLCKCGRDRVEGSRVCAVHRQAMIAKRRGPRPSFQGPERNSWRGAIYRCADMEDPNYGGRGIRVCDRWLGDDGFTNFLADMGPRPPGTSIDRKDVNGHYEPLNCRWATAEEQARNTRANRNVTIGGVTKTISEWAREKGMSSTGLASRVERMGPDAAFAFAGWDRVRGARHKRSKLTAEQAERIFRRRLAGERLTAIADDFGVSFALVSKIAKGKSWGHLTRTLSVDPSLAGLIPVKGGGK